MSFPQVVKISDSRKKAINARLSKYTIDDFKQLFINAEASAFLKGDNGRNWQASFDWLIKDSNMPKVLEGNYNDKAVVKKANTGFNDFPQSKLDNELDEMEKLFLQEVNSK
ncbi:MAG: hypothetical protein IJ141_03575 [Lachnospiraceae bacterium]|nr:hypothetical protein [Lachnospiraceae bacterium]